jgi:hypothetical protein
VEQIEKPRPDVYYAVHEGLGDDELGYISAS